MRGLGQKGRPNDYRKTIRRLAAYVSREKTRLALAVICVFIATGSQLASSYMLRPVINTYIAPPDGSAGNPAGLFAALCVMTVVYLVGIAGTYTQSRLLIRVGQNSLKSMREDLFAHMQKLPVRFYDTNTRGDLMSRYTNDIDNVGNMLSSTLISLFTAALTLTGTLALMLYTNVILTLVTVVVMPFMLAAARRIAGASSKYFSSQQAALGALNGYIEENVTGQKIVKVFNHESVCDEEFGILNEELRKNQMKAQFYSGLMGPVMNCSTQINYTLTAAVGGILSVLKGLDIGGLTVFLNYSRMFNRPVNEISMTISAVFSALAGAERVFAVMDEQPEPSEPELTAAADEGTGAAAETQGTGNVHQMTAEYGYGSAMSADKDILSAAVTESENKNACSIRRLHGDIVMEDVSFGYTADKTILKHVNVYAHPGQKIAFVGSTGAGKTTVMNLLPRFYDIDEGSITIDGKDIKSYTMRELRSNITMVLQESHLFSGTIMENIRYGRLDASDEEVMAAAAMASADSFIRHMPHGYETIIDADGSNLSQGQRQLLNIARAAISRAPILILDEATSSVDTRTEKLIERGMDRLMSTRTTFIIAHRLSTVRDANAIMVLENGVIIERGTHDDLLKAKGRYYELYTGMAELD